MSTSRTATKARAVGDALRMAFDEYAGPLLRLCTVLTGGRAEAEDLVQESFIRLAPKVDSLPGEAVWPYLRRIALNQWKNRLRRLAVETRARRSEVDPRLGAPSVEEKDWVWAAVLRLPRRQRACVVLRYYEDLTEAETAAILECSVGTVKSQSAKALAKLTEALGHED